MLVLIDARLLKQREIFSLNDLLTDSQQLVAGLIESLLSFQFLLV